MPRQITVQVSFRITDHWWQVLSELAYDTGISPHAYAKKLLLERLYTEKRKLDLQDEIDEKP